MISLFYLLRSQKYAVFMTLWVQKLAYNYISLCEMKEKKLFWRYKWWLSWKQCVILAWHSHTWVAQTCESAKQTTRIASAVTIWERSWTLSSFYSLKSGHMVETLLYRCCPQTGLCGLVFSSLQRKCEETLSQVKRERNMLRYAIRMNNRYVMQPCKSPKAVAFAVSVDARGSS